MSSLTRRAYYADALPAGEDAGSAGTSCPILLSMLVALFFIPDIGMSIATPVGVLDPSDYILAGMYAIFFFSRGVRSGTPGAVSARFVAFVFISFLSTVVWFVVWDPDAASWNGPTKLAKFAGYAMVGPLLARHVFSFEDNARLIKSLALGACVAAAAIYYTAAKAYASGAGFLSKSEFPYEASNVLSVALAAVGVFLAFLPTFPGMPVNWRRWRVIPVAAIFGAMLLTGGRGGWLGAMTGVTYLTFVLKRGTRAVWLAAVIGGAAAYLLWSAFVQKNVEGVIRIESEGYRREVVRIDDRGRINTWLHELGKFPDHPILGVGFYTRGGRSGLWRTGSHNMFIQVLLETGIVGFAAFMLLLHAVWKSAPVGDPRDPADIRSRYNLAFRAALISICASSVTGEYFYGGLSLGATSMLFGLTASFNRLMDGSEAVGPEEPSLPAKPGRAGSL
ncbi:MAG: O-antigen ligase family protein [Planctomycetota bacterium]|nr:O-antigen ligase family protein [Planctomycetota bacterium]